MTMHSVKKYQCIKCGLGFVPFEAPDTLCPECGESNPLPDEFAEIIKEIIDANVYHRVMSGSSFQPPMGYMIFSAADHYIYYSGVVFDKYFESRCDTLEQFIQKEVIASEENPGWIKYHEDLFRRLFEEGEKRNIFSRTV